MSTLLFEANADTEDVPDMSIREPVSTNMKCGPIGRKSMVLTNPPGAQVCPMVAPDVAGGGLTVHPSTAALVWIPSLHRSALLYSNRTAQPGLLG